MSLPDYLAPDTCLDIDTMFADLERGQVGQRPFGAPSGVGDSCGTSVFCRTVEPVPDSSFSRQDTPDDFDELIWLDNLKSDRHEKVSEQLATDHADSGPCVLVPQGCSAPAQQSTPLGLQQPTHLDAVCQPASFTSGYQTGAAQCVARLRPCPVLPHQLSGCMPAALPAVAASAADPAGRSPLQTVLNGPSQQVASAADGQQAHSLYESSPIVLGQLVSVGSTCSSNTTGATQSVAAWQTCSVLTNQLPRYMPGALPIAASAADPVGSSSLQTVLYGASTASTAAGQLGHTHRESSPPVVLGQLTSAGSLCSSSTAFCPEFTGGVRADAGFDSSQHGNTCLGCKTARRLGCTLAAECATNSKMTPSARARAVEVIARAAACPRQCLITLQLPTESCGCSSSSSPEFFVSFAKARLAEQGCQRARQGTATSRNFNYNCNAPIKMVDGSLSACLGCQDSDNVFTVASSDKRINMTAIGITRLAVSTSAEAAAAAATTPTDSNCNSPLVSGSCNSCSSESLWCSQAVTCTKSLNKYQGQSFDLYTWALFLQKSARH